MRVVQALNDLSSTERIFKKICVIWFSVFWSSAFSSHPLDALNGSNKLPLPGRFVAASRRSSIWTANLDINKAGGSNVDVWHFHQPIDVRCFELHIIDFHMSSLSPVPQCRLPSVEPWSQVYIVLY